MPHPALPGEHVGEVRHLQLVGPLCLEEPVDPVRLTQCPNYRLVTESSLLHSRLALQKRPFSQAPIGSKLPGQVTLTINSLSKVCKLVGLSRSACYKPKTDWAAKDATVVDTLNAIVAVRARWDFWNCSTRMRKADLPWSHKRVHGVYSDMRPNIKRRTKKRGITREPQPLRGSTQLNQVWALDFMRDTLYNGRPF
jgi:hypothetical protein